MFDVRHLDIALIATFCSAESLYRSVKPAAQKQTPHSTAQMLSKEKAALRAAFSIRNLPFKRKPYLDFRR
jgi:hypothetical protein